MEMLFARIVSQPLISVYSTTRPISSALDAQKAFTSQKTIPAVKMEMFTSNQKEDADLTMTYPTTAEYTT